MSGFVSSFFSRTIGCLRRVFARGNVFAVAPLVLAISGCGPSKPVEENRELVVYSAGPRELAEWVCAAFEKETGSKTRLFVATTGEVMAKLQAEESHPVADVVILASSIAAEVLKQSDALSPLPELPATPPSEWLDSDRRYAGTSASALGIAVRTDHLGEIRDWDDVFAGRVSGSLIMPSPSQSGTSGEFVTAAHLAMGEKLWDGLKTAKKGGLQISGPNSQALTSLILGSHVAVLAAADYLVFKQIERGEPLAMVFPPSGCPVIPRPIAILRGAHNPALAGKFVQFWFSRPVQEEIARQHLIPAIADIPLSDLRRQAELHPLPLDPVQAVQVQREVLKRFRYEIERN